MIFNQISERLPLVGKILISTPYMEGGSCFSKSVIYMLTHDETGSLGVIVNRVITSIKPEFILQSLDLDIDASKVNFPIHFGGPVESEKGLILHSNDYENKSILQIKESLSVSSNINILTDIIEGNGPENSLFALGYSGWVPEQLEKEIKNNLWIVVPYSHELVFSYENKDKWNAAINSLGISPANFCSSYGLA